MEFVKGLSGEKEVQAVARHGEEPRTISCDTRDAMLERISDDIAKETEADTIAVLCLDAESAADTHSGLQRMMPERAAALLTKDSMKFEKGISVMPFYLAKGLEFDVVFVPGPAERAQLHPRRERSGPGQQEHPADRHPAG